jgi:hypothetical protein
VGTLRPVWRDLAVVLSAGLAVWKKTRWRSFAAGCLIGLGIAALIEGVCFLTVLR